MTLIVNGKPCLVSAATLDAVMAELGFTAACVATAVNSEFVPAAQRLGRSLQDGDNIEVLAPMSGG